MFSVWYTSTAEPYDIPPWNFLEDGYITSNSHSNVCEVWINRNGHPATTT